MYGTIPERDIDFYKIQPELCNYVPTLPLKTIKSFSHDNDTMCMILDGHGEPATVAFNDSTSNKCRAYKMYYFGAVKNEVYTEAGYAFNYVKLNTSYILHNRIPYFNLVHLVIQYQFVQPYESQIVIYVISAVSAILLKHSAGRHASKLKPCGAK